MKRGWRKRETGHSADLRLEFLRLQCSGLRPVQVFSPACSTNERDKPSSAEGGKEPLHPAFLPHPGLLTVSLIPSRHGVTN